MKTRNGRHLEPDPSAFPSRRSFLDSTQTKRILKRCARFQPSTAACLRTAAFAHLAAHPKQPVPVPPFCARPVPAVSTVKMRSKLIRLADNRPHSPVPFEFQPNLSFRLLFDGEAFDRYYVVFSTPTDDATLILFQACAAPAALATVAFNLAVQSSHLTHASNP